MAFFVIKFVCIQNFKKELFVHEHNTIYKRNKQFNFNLNNYYSKPVIKHISNFVHGCINPNFKGKLTQIHYNSFSKNHRTTKIRFFNNSPWNESILDNNLNNCIYYSINASFLEILTHYQNRWSIEVYFKNVKQYLSFGGYQIRKSKSINRFLLLLKLTYCFVILSKSINFNKLIKQLYYIKHSNIIDFMYFEALSGFSLKSIKIALSAA